MARRQGKIWTNQTGSNNIFKYTTYAGVNRSYHYIVYSVSNDEWVAEIENTDTDYTNYINWNDVLYANYTIQNGLAETPVVVYNNENNQTDISGIPVDTSIIYTFKTYQYKNNTWVLIGTSTFEGLLSQMKDYVDTATTDKQDKPSNVTLTDGSTVALADNTEYSGTELTNLTFTYPQGDFECYLSLSFASSGTISVTFPTSQYIGSAPTFENGKTYEISIRNGVIVAGEVTSGA